MRIVLLGAPGAGKGTQAVILAEKLNVPHISTGDIFRSNIANGTELGKKAKEYIDKGELVPDEVTIGIVRDRLEKPDCKNGFILDGFPRTIPQAECLDEILESMGTPLEYVVDIDVDDEYIIKRLSGRRVCPGCGASYHITNNPPAKPGICDKCGTEIIQRKDDNEETVLNRLKTYHLQTEPLIDYYRKQGKLISVDGRLNIEDTTRSILKAVGVI
ncbi:MAG TPA: adenylate kinase [Clostridiaceae bacterium]|nr:adenylate kinase [Clostridiaceae bacterium]